MIVIPAVDLREGACVQLVGGSYTDERVRRDDPLEVAREWTNHGFRRLHVVDLDAATGRGNNRSVVRGILDSADVPVQVGGEPSPNPQEQSSSGAQSRLDAHAPGSVISGVMPV